MRLDNTRLGGLAGMLSAGTFVPAFVLLVTTYRGGDAERTLGNFEAPPGVLIAMLGLILVSDLLYIGFLTGLYRGLREHAKVVSLVSFGVGLAALALGILFLTVTIVDLVGPREVSRRLAGPDPEIVGLASILLVGLPIFGFGLAMRRASRFSLSLAIATMATGAFVVASVILMLFPLPLFAKYGYAALGGAVLWGRTTPPQPTGIDAESPG